MLRSKISIDCMLSLHRQQQESRKGGHATELTRSGQEPNRKWTAAAPSAEFRDLLQPATKQPAGNLALPSLTFFPSVLSSG